MVSEDEVPFEESVDFNEQREFLARYLPAHNYFVDWLIDVICELHGDVSPYGYAARVCTAQKIAEHVNLEHATASQKTLIRVIRNLFPYDRMQSKTLRGPLARCLGVGKEIKQRPYRSLNDKVVKAAELVNLRYSVLVKAIIGYTISLTKVLYTSLDEEAIPDYRHFADDTIKECAADMEELKKFRNFYFFDFPEEEVCAVSSYAESLYDKLKKRKEMPRDMDAALVFQNIMKYQQIIRGRLQSIIIKGKEIEQIILEQRGRYIAQTSELTMMISTLQSFLSTDADWHAIEEEIGKFLKDLEEKFRLDRYLPADVLEDIRLEHQLYKQGYP